MEAEAKLLNDSLNTNYEAVKTFISMRSFWMDIRAQVMEPIININHPIQGVRLVTDHLEAMNCSGTISQYKKYNETTPIRLVIEYDNTPKSYYDLMIKMNEEFDKQVKSMTTFSDTLLAKSIELYNIHEELARLQPALLERNKLNLRIAKEKQKQLLRAKIVSIKSTLDIIFKYGCETRDLMNDGVTWDSQLFPLIYGRYLDVSKTLDSITVSLA